jgi:hypothetical protein
MDAHFGAQIIGSDQQHIDTRHGGDLFGIADLPSASPASRLSDWRH